MASLVLEIRPSDHFEWFDELPSEMQANVYALAIISTPTFPGEHHPEGNSLSMVCAYQYVTEIGERAGEYLWGWVHLGPDAKEELGNALVDGGAEVGKWYYLRISSKSELDS